MKQIEIRMIDINKYMPIILSAAVNKVLVPREMRKATLYLAI